MAGAKRGGQAWSGSGLELGWGLASGLDPALHDRGGHVRPKRPAYQCGRDTLGARDGNATTACSFTGCTRPRGRRHSAGRGIPSGTGWYGRADCRGGYFDTLVKDLFLRLGDFWAKIERAMPFPPWAKCNKTVTLTIVVLE